MNILRIRKFIAFILIFLFILEISSAKVHASWLPWGKTESNNMDLRFSTVYPKSFLQTTAGKIALYVGSAVVVAGVTYFTAGVGTAASAGTIATFIGGTIGSLKGLTGIAAINAGLAMLGGGAVASGGLGILGGITVLNVIGDFALAAAIDTAVLAIPQNSTHDFLEVIKLPMFYNNVSSVAEDDLDDLEDSLDEGDLEKVTFFLKRIENKLTEEVKKTNDETTAYNYLMLSIIQYNNQDFTAARGSVESAKSFVNTKQSSVLDYIEALLYLIEGNEQESLKLLFKISQQEPKAIQPYVVRAQINYDNKLYDAAFDILKRGLNDADDEDCTLNWMAGNCLYANQQYGEAIPYYRTALSNMTMNEIEALYKLNIAKCYKKLGDSKNGTKWLDDAIGEVKENADMVAELRQEYEAD